MSAISRSKRGERMWRIDAWVVEAEKEAEVEVVKVV
jgi:hypothetical protein